MSLNRIPGNRVALLVIAVLLTGCTSSDISRFSPAEPMASAVLDQTTPLSRLAFGSCFSSYESGAIFQQIISEKPDAFIFLGDNVYAKDERNDPSLLSLREAYAALAANADFALLREEVPVLATWDDHDMGLNDAGGDWPHQPLSESLFEYVWAIPGSDPSAKRPGIYRAVTIGEGDRSVQLILLDTRSFRTPLTLHPDQSVGRYTPSTSPDQNMLGDDQWQWLAEQLRSPAALRIIVTSVQVIAEGHYWEAWRMLPQERTRLYELLRSTNANGVILVSGDRHGAYTYQRGDILDYPLYEMTTSSLNLPLSGWVDNPQPEPGPHRLGGAYFEANYGVIDFRWDQREVILGIMDAEGSPVEQRIININALR